jgi:hypothetical protein
VRPWHVARSARNFIFEPRGHGADALRKHPAPALRVTLSLFHLSRALLVCGRLRLIATHELKAKSVHRLIDAFAPYQPVCVRPVVFSDAHSLVFAPASFAMK